MSRDPLQEELLAELLRQQEQADRSEAVFEAAEELYAPAALGPEAVPLPAPGKLNSFLANLKPDRLVTYPIWVLVNVALFGSLALLMLAVQMFGTAVLMMIGAAIDGVVGIGIPLARIGAAGVGVLAGVGTIAHLYRSFLERLRTCPW